MPISEKILYEVKCLNVSEMEKTLLVDVLNLEDEGLRNYTKRYEEVIKAYIKMINEREEQ